MEDVATTRHAPAWLRWAAAVAYAAGIFVLSSLPAGKLPLPEPFWHADKLLHFFTFAGLGALLMWASERFWVAVLGAAVYGGIDELHQALTPGRDPSGLDWLADIAGGLAAVLVILALSNFRGNRHADHS